jgi:pantetheine-phosphate adenylyltransferase/dephospho-CoA kinase
MKKAMYAFSGDPITYGHIDIIERASKVFDQLIVGIGVNPEKKYTFSLEERTNMANKSLNRYDNVKVVSFSGLLVDYAYENNVNVIIKGVRNSVDFDYENVLHQVGESQKVGIDTHILFAKPELSHVSSSAVKGIQKENGLLIDYVPIHVKQKLEERISKQYIVGLTGEIGSGKSYVGKKFVELGKEKGISIHNIELDYIGHQILGELNEPAYVEVRNQIANTFGKQIQNENGTIDRKLLGEIVFDNASSWENLQKLNQIMVTPLMVRLRKEIYGKEGLILLNSALIAESNKSYLCNNNVVLVSVDSKTQEERLRTRNLTDEQIKKRLANQHNYMNKFMTIQNEINKDNNGHIFDLDNSQGKDEIEKVFDEVISEMNIR